MPFLRALIDLMLPSIVLVTWAYKSLVLSFLSYNYWILFSCSGSGEKWWRDLNDFRCTSPFPGANSLEGGVIYKITKDKSYISSCTRWSFEEHYWNVKLRYGALKIFPLFRLKNLVFVSCTRCKQAKWGSYCYRMK